MAPIFLYAPIFLQAIGQMVSRTFTWLTAAATVSAAVPSLVVPACPRVATITYNQSVPNRSNFPHTQVDICYGAQAIRIDFTAFNETSFFTNSSYGTNDPIYEYEVMEAFIYKGANDPKQYLEFEVAPNNITFNAFIYNPSRVRARGAPFDRFYISEPVIDGLTVETNLDRDRQIWHSYARIPLGLFNVDDNQANGTQWRMNFLRTVVSPETFPDQLLGAWSVPDEASFHKTPFFGNVRFA